MLAYFMGETLRNKSLLEKKIFRYELSLQMNDLFIAR